MVALATLIPLHVYGMLSFPTAGGLYALNADTGKLLWTAKTPPYLPPPAGGGYVSAPVVQAGLAVFGCFDPHLCEYGIYAVNASTGALKWAVPTRGGVAARVAAVAAGIDGLATFYVGSRMSEKDGLIVPATFYAVDETGRVRWSVPQRDNGDFEGDGAIVALGKVFAGAGDSNVNAYDAKTGGGRWAHRTAGGVLGAGSVINMSKQGIH